MQKEIKILSGQNLADMTIQETGLIDSIFEVAALNGIGITDDIIVDTNLKVDERSVNDKKYRLIKLANIIPATDFEDLMSDIERPELGGIGYMAIGIDFKVS